jgi:hypothetical protein
MSGPITSHRRLLRTSTRTLARSTQHIRFLPKNSSRRRLRRLDTGSRLNGQPWAVYQKHRETSILNCVCVWHTERVYGLHCDSELVFPADAYADGATMRAQQGEIDIDPDTQDARYVLV